MFPKQQIDGFEKYWRRRKPGSSTALNYASDIRILFSWAEGQPPEAITVHDVDEFIGWQQNLGRAQATIRRRLIALRMFYDYLAYICEERVANPVIIWVLCISRYTAMLRCNQYLSYFGICIDIDGCGPYHYTTSVADLDGDGDLDVLLSGLRHESETIFWAGSFLWTNQGGGEFTPQGVDYGGPSAAAGDVDGDGDSDVVRLDYRATLFLNQGGEQGGKTGDFKQGPSITPKEGPHNWSTPAPCCSAI